MSDFWSNVLGPAAPQPEPPPVNQDIPWWQRTIVNVPTSQQQQPAAPAPAVQGNEPTQREIEELHLSRTQWARETTGGCPSCGSVNYSRHPEFPGARPRCFDCGYPITQTGSGAAVQGDQAGPVKAARQTVASRTNNFNPHHIVHHMHPQEKG